MQINDGSCLSNMQCVLNSEAEGYDQVCLLLLSFLFMVLYLGLLDKLIGKHYKSEENEISFYVV